MEVTFELDTALTVKCVSTVACTLSLMKVSITLENSQLAIANSLVLLTIIIVFFGQCLALKK